MSESWQLSGKIVIACSCDYGCPCNFNALPTHGHCEGGWLWKVESGRFGDVDLADAAFSLYADWPAAIHEGGGRAVAYLDERLDDAQRAAVEQLLQGRAGGPWGIFISTYVLEGPHVVRHDVDLDDKGASVRIGDVVELETEAIRNPVTGAETRAQVLLPSGLVTHRAAMLASRVFRITDGVAYDHSGQYAALGDFRYTGP